MSSIMLIGVGVLLVWVGWGDIATETLTGIKSGSLPGYVDMPLSRFLIGAIIVTLPLVALNYQNQEKTAWKYVLLISVMMVVLNYKGLESFQKYLTSIL